ncbi:MAG: alginate export family protein [Phycisphaerae bacterium]|nr:alginate export family protein [Phycisphaerae bacterium]
MKSKCMVATSVSLVALLVASSARMAMAQATTQPSGAAAVEKPPADPFDEFVEKTKNPFPGFNWGMDMRLRWEYLNNVGFDKQAPNHETSYMRLRTRWWGTLQPLKPLNFEDLEFHIKLTWEGRSWCENDPVSGWDQSRDQVVFDNLYLKYKKAFGLPLTITAGRQDLPFAWLTGDGTPNDGSRTFFVDGVRFEYDAEPIKTKFDVAYFEVDAQWDHWFPRIANKRVPGLASDQDEQGVMVYVSNKSLPKTQIDGYFFYKRNEAEYFPVRDNPTTDEPRRSGDNADIYTFGGRVAGDITDNWRYDVQLAGQFGHRDGREICALGSVNKLSYNFNDKYKNQVYLEYEYTSGDDPGTPGRDEKFDILWGRYPRWTEGYGYSYGVENRVWDLGNTHRVGPGWSCKPMKDLEVALYYQFLFADENTYADTRTGFSDNGNFRGQILVPYFKYTINKYAFFRVMPEFFFPGDYYTDDRNDPLTFLRLELNLTW